MGKKADDAFQRAQGLIAQARRASLPDLALGHSAFGPNDFSSLEALPIEISDLTGLRSLSIWNTSVSDISALRTLKELIWLDLVQSPVRDLSPLSELTKLESLNLWGTNVSDLSALSGMVGLVTLDILGTKVRDLSALRNMQQLMFVDLRGTLVTREQLLHLVGKPWLIPPENRDLKYPAGVRFIGCAAAKADTKLARIAGIRDDRERTIRLFEYLGTEVDEEADAGENPPPIPDRQSAPLETEVRDECLTVALRVDPPLAPGPVQDRARIGWEAIREALDDLGRSVHLENYRSLAAAFGALDRALGPRFEDMNAIKVGISGQALSELARDEVFLATLPEGVGSQVKALAATVATFANRFPDWLAYQEDAVGGRLVADDVQAELGAFEALAKSLEQAPDVDLDVAEDYRTQVDWVRAVPTSEVAARGLLASTRELLRTLAENVILGARLYADSAAETARGSGGAIARELREVRAVVPGEIRKAVFWGVIGVSSDIMLFKGTMLLALATKFPRVLGWLADVVAWLA